MGRTAFTEVKVRSQGYSRDIAKKQESGKKEKGYETGKTDKKEEQ